MTRRTGTHLPIVIEHTNFLFQNPLVLQRFLHPIFASAQVSHLMRPRRKFLKAGAVPRAVHFMWPRHQQVWIWATEHWRALTLALEFQPRGDPSGWCRRAAPKTRGMSQFILRARPVSKLLSKKHHRTVGANKYATCEMEISDLRQLDMIETFSWE